MLLNKKNNTKLMNNIIQKLSDRSEISYQQAQTIFEKVSKAVLKNTTGNNRQKILSKLPTEITNRLSESEKFGPVIQNVSYKQVCEDVNNDLNLKEISNSNKVVVQAIKILEDDTGLKNLLTDIK